MPHGNHKLIFDWLCVRELFPMEGNDVCFYPKGIRGCRGKLYTNLDATQVIRTCEHADGWRVDPHTLYHQQQLNELKRLAAGLDAAAYFPSLDQARNTMYYSRAKRYPRLPARRQDLRLTAEQTTTKCSAQFLIYHSPTNDILIFATEAGVRLLVRR
ncbi:hypothetical protein T05_11314 [Trichinella murrelli]|uniref:Uncharacterized protein n=1 Tax=Trichinella murrelli TaxID=144512 RepID=A0A0V0TDJ9_9BILA|nr:hypothetical protein T05_11314 [Trichinella murrelli]